MELFLEVWFSNYCWCRKFLGGKWEQWWVEPCRSMVWHKVDRFTADKVLEAKLNCYQGDLSDPDIVDPYWWGYRPSPLCAGDPVCEDWTKREDGHNISKVSKDYKKSTIT